MRPGCGAPILMAIVVVAGLSGKDGAVAQQPQLQPEQPAQALQARQPPTAQPRQPPPSRARPISASSARHAIQPAAAGRPHFRGWSRGWSRVVNPPTVAEAETSGR